MNRERHMDREAEIDQAIADLRAHAQGAWLTTGEATAIADLLEELVRASWRKLSQQEKGYPSPAATPNL